MKIMLIDDEPGLLDAYRAVLGKKHEIHTFQNPRDALAQYDDTFDLVITDHRMPGKNGEAVIFDIKYINPAQKIVVVSGLTDEVNLPSDFEVEKFQKPFSIPDLLELIKRMS